MPALRAKGAALLLETQRQIAEALLAAFPGDLDPVVAAAMTGSVLGAIQQATLASAALGRSQADMWQAAEAALDIAAHGLLSVRPSADDRPQVGRGPGDPADDPARGGS